MRAFTCHARSRVQQYRNTADGNGAGHSEGPAAAAGPSLGGTVRHTSPPGGGNGIPTPVFTGAGIPGSLLGWVRRFKSVDDKGPQGAPVSHRQHLQATVQAQRKVKAGPLHRLLSAGVLWIGTGHVRRSRLSRLGRTSAHAAASTGGDLRLGSGHGVIISCISRATSAQGPRAPAVVGTVPYARLYAWRGGMLASNRATPSASSAATAS